MARKAGKYRLKKGFEHHVHDEKSDRGLRLLKAGETIELTRDQANAWADKFEPAAAADVERDTTDDDDDVEDDADDTDDDTEVEETDKERRQREKAEKKAAKEAKKKKK